MNVLVLHGPNLNLLGERVGDDGEATLAGVEAMLLERAGELGVTLKTFQSNHEGALVDKLHAERAWADAVIVSPDALAQTGWVLRTALAAVGKPAVEVHLGARKASVVKAACVAQVTKKGVDGYLLALEGLAGGRWVKKGKGAAAKKGAKAALPAKAPAAPRLKVALKAEPRDEAVALKPLRVEPAKAAARPEPARPEKTLGRIAPTRQPRGEVARKVSGNGLSRALVRQKIADRLAGKLSPGALASWARSQWLEVQRGAAAESGHREELEEALQSLTTSVYPGSHLTDDELISLMSQLAG